MVNTSASQSTRNPNLTVNEAYANEDHGLTNLHVCKGDNTLAEERWRKAGEAETPRDDRLGDLHGPRPDWWWTGPKPIDGEHVYSLPMPDLSSCTRQDLLNYFDNGWLITELLFSALQDEATFIRRPWHLLRHPLIFYYAHPAVFYVNKLCVAGLLEKTLNPELEQIFETGVDEMSWDDLSRDTQSYCAVREVTEYRRTTYSLVRNIIETHPDFGNSNWLESDVLGAILMGFEHERIHIETSSVLMRELPVTLVLRPRAFPGYHPTCFASESNPHPIDGEDYPTNEWVAVSEGDAILGKPKDYPSFGWDNEYGTHELHVKEFKATSMMISNGEFLAFVKDGGYANKSLWTELGWGWRTFRNAKWPAFWVANGPQGSCLFKLRVLYDIVAMPWSWPAIVNYHEAKAYCAWLKQKDGLPEDRQYHILTEAHHQRIRGEEGNTDVVLKTGGDRMPSVGRNTNLAYLSESPVDLMQANTAGFRDVFGNAWEWAEDHMAPLEGFDVHPLYDDFTTPTFDGDHNLILGGSWASTGDQCAMYARYAFRPHFYQHAGFRVVEDAKGRIMTSCIDAPPPYVGTGPCCVSDNKRNKKYDETGVLNELLGMHYGEANTIAFADAPQNALDFPRRCALKLVGFAQKHGVQMKRALDVGCAVGRACFELAREYEEVIGLDLSPQFIEAANEIKQNGTMTYSLKVEGNLSEECAAVVAADIDRARVTFKRADATCLGGDLGQYDAVLLGNLLDRLPSPKACLGRMGGGSGLVRPGGLLLITNPASWLEDFTPRGSWLGGYEKAGKRVRTLDGLHALLDAEFELIEESNMPFLLREHERKFEYIVPMATVWRRR